MNDEVAKIIEELAMLQFSIPEISVISGIGLSELTSEYKFFIDRGRLLAEAEVRRSILNSAKEGAANAQKQFMDLNRRAKAINKSAK